MLVVEKQGRSSELRKLSKSLQARVPAAKQSHKLHSKTEKDFAIILEDDSTALKWLRPASKQFKIYWKHRSKQYHPDFVVETENAIYLVETKKEMDIDNVEVQEKAEAAKQYCKHATAYTSQHGGKLWQYVLIPHGAVKQNMSLDILLNNN